METYLFFGGTSYGPYPGEQILQMHRQGQLPEDTRIYVPPGTWADLSVFLAGAEAAGRMAAIDGAAAVPPAQAAAPVAQQAAEPVPAAVGMTAMGAGQWSAGEPTQTAPEGYPGSSYPAADPNAAGQYWGQAPATAGTIPSQQGMGQQSAGVDQTGYGAYPQPMAAPGGYEQPGGYPGSDLGSPQVGPAAGQDSDGQAKTGPSRSLLVLMAIATLAAGGGGAYLLIVMQSSIGYAVLGVAGVFAILLVVMLLRLNKQQKASDAAGQGQAGQGQPAPGQTPGYDPMTAQGNYPGAGHSGATGPYPGQAPGGYQGGGYQGGGYQGGGQY